ncbi:MAG: ornithine cyclodeaminase family protein [Victivallales bacterium]|nr:ornithine cyclodeaminase family protein [Victivallales bacterium]
MIYLAADDVRRALPMPEAVSAMRRAFAQLASGAAVVPPRTVIDLPAERGDFLLMPAVLDGGKAVGAKLLTLLPGNPQAGRPLIHALMVLFDGETGQPSAILDGGALTAIRTGAVSGVATDLLARQDSVVVGVVGAGRQARTQLEAVCCVRSIRQVHVFDAIPAAAESFAAEMSATLGIRIDPAATAGDAVAQADIVCAATTSGTPVFGDEDVRPGTHLNAIGCYHTHRHEIPPETVGRASVVVDQLEAARDEAGDIVIAIERGLMSWQDVYAELGELAAGQKPGRRDDDEITLFKSVGLALQDVAAAACLLENARGLGLGIELG